MIPRTVKRVLAGVAAYALLWLGTMVVGVPWVHDQVVARERVKLSRARPNAEVHEVVGRANDVRVGHPVYWVTVNSPGPLLVRVTYGSEIAPLTGSGGTEWVNRPGFSGELVT